MLHVWWKGSVYNISPLRSADSIHIIYIDLELIYLYCILKIYVDAMGWVVTPLRSVTFLDDQTTSKSMQEKLHDGQCRKTKTWNTI